LNAEKQILLFLSGFKALPLLLELQQSPELPLNLSCLSDKLSEVSKWMVLLILFYNCRVKVFSARILSILE